MLISPQTAVGKDNPYSREKLCPVLAFYVEDSWEAACRRSIEILRNEGAGHTMTIHSQDKSVIREFALKKPVFSVTGEYRGISRRCRSDNGSPSGSHSGLWCGGWQCYLR